MITIKCDTCVNEFNCTTYFNCIKKKFRTLKVLTMMCENLGGYKKISKLCVKNETKDPCKNCSQLYGYHCKARIKYLYKQERRNENYSI